MYVQETSRICCRGNISIMVLLSTDQISCVSTGCCQLSSNRAFLNSVVLTISVSRSLPKPIVLTFPNNGRSPKAVAPTSPIDWNHPKSIVQTVPTNLQRVKSFVSTFSIRQFPRSFVWIIPKAPDINRSDNSSSRAAYETNCQGNFDWYSLQHYWSGQFQLLNSTRYQLFKASQMSLVGTNPIIWPYSRSIV